MALTFDPADFRQQVRGEVMGNILPFWMAHVVDKAHGGFYGAVTHDLQVHHDVPRSAILCARILWTYAAAYRRWGAEPYLSMAQWAYDYLTSVFWDQEYGGVYWHVDSQGHPVADRKHHYAQAFAIYGLSEYYRATQEPHSLRLAQRLYHLLETHAYDPVHGGYIEGSSREWDALADMRLSDKEPHCRKSMNTLLHILEAYTNLLQVWGAAHLQAQLSALLELFLGQIVDPGTKHYRLFFDDGWHSLLETVSFGHDIEGSWLLVEAADAVGDPALLARAGDCAVRLATAVYREGRDGDGSLFSEAGPQGVLAGSKEWWGQAEGMVGFYAAYQLTGRVEFAQASHRCWTYIQTHLVDRVHGDWFKRLQRDGTPDPTSYKVGPWECPYHQARACFEMLDRL
jgi:mannobiose 2-epimerase